MEARDYIGALIARGWTQSQIAERVDIPQPTISKIVRGDVEDVLSRKYRRLQALYSEVVGEVSAAGHLMPKPSEEANHAAPKPVCSEGAPLLPVASVQAAARSEAEASDAA